MNIIILPILFPLVAAALCLFARYSLPVQRIVSGIATHTVLGLVLFLAAGLRDGGVMTLRVGGWPGTYGIVLVLDLLSAIMLVLSALVQTATWWFCILGGMEKETELRYFHPVFLLLTAGVNWAFVTGDLFNLFVSFELILIASYVLLIKSGSPATLREGSKFVVLNVIAGVLFLTGAGLVYGLYGTLNLADLAVKLGRSQHQEMVVVIGTLFLVVFGIKAGLFPLFFWLPDAYPRAPAAVLPYFSGILTKVGVYCLYRCHTLVFRAGVDEWFQPLILAIGGATMIVGVLGALSRNSFREILSFHIVSQIGYMIFGLGLFTQNGLTGGIFYIMHHIVVKSSLFMIAACVILQTGTDRLEDLGGLMAKSPFLAGLFLFAAFSLAGLPPLSGFYGKYVLVLEGIERDQLFYVVLSVITSLLTLASMVKIWMYAFMGGDENARKAALPRPGAAWATFGLVSLAAVVLIFSGPLMNIAETAAASLMDPSIYIDAVHGPVETDVAEVRP